MKEKRFQKKFEESYFQGWYKKAVGSFSQNDLELSKRWFWAWLEKLNEYVPVRKGTGRKVLEVGCSIGAVANLLSERGFKVWASDISEYAVENAKKLTPKAQFVVLDIQKKVILKEKFDIVIAFEVVEHLNQPDLSIKNIYDCLEKDGIAVISTPYPYPWNFRDLTHINVKYPQEWVSMIKKAGFRTVSYHRFTLIPFFYRFNKHFQIIIPFVIPVPYLNSPIYFIAKK